MTDWVALVAVLFAAPFLAASDCIPIHEASQHVGETKCVRGMVVGIKVGVKDVHFLDFCEDQVACPFTVVIFPHDLKDVGDIRRPAGRMIEIHGQVNSTTDAPRSFLNRISQITGRASLIPPIPKNYDVENRGHYSTGRLRPSKKPKKTKAKPNTTQTFGNDVEGQEPRE